MTDEKFRKAAQNYRNGYTCSQAVFCAYCDEMGIDEQTAKKFTEGLGGGFGGMQEMCGALSAALAVISYFVSDGSVMNPENRTKVYSTVQKAAETFRREYGGVRCIDVLRGQKPQPFKCGMKIKDVVLIIEQTISELKDETHTPTFPNLPA